MPKPHAEGKMEFPENHPHVVGIYNQAIVKYALDIYKPKWHKYLKMAQDGWGWPYIKKAIEAELAIVPPLARVPAAIVRGVLDEDRENYEFMRKRASKEGWAWKRGECVTLDPADWSDAWIDPRGEEIVENGVRVGWRAETADRTRLVALLDDVIRISEKRFGIPRKVTAVKLLTQRPDWILMIPEGVIENVVDVAAVIEAECTRPRIGEGGGGGGGKVDGRKISIGERKKNEIPEGFMSLKTLAAFLDVSVMTVHRWAQDGKFPTQVAGRFRAIRVVSIEDARKMKEVLDARRAMGSEITVKGEIAAPAEVVMPAEFVAPAAPVVESAPVILTSEAAPTQPILPPSAKPSKKIRGVE